jgi:CRP-like cAMP-binding protein
MSIRPHEEPVVGNLLLAQLPVHERNAIQRGSETHEYPAGETLITAKAHSDFVFFPINGVVSVIRSVRPGQSIELALVGSEGMVGLDAFIDVKVQLDDAVVQSGGCFYRMPGEELRRQMHRASVLQRCLFRFANSFMDQVAQNAVCYRFHSVESRLARWLLMVDDRRHVSEMHESPSIGTALGVDEATVSAALEQLATAKGIRFRRHVVTIVDREGLELHACECYDTLRDSCRA